jgi:hypothetical protein
MITGYLRLRPFDDAEAAQLEQFLFEQACRLEQAAALMGQARREKRSFEAEEILLEQALTKCIQQRDETLRQLRDAARRVDKAAFKDQSDFGPAHHALLNICDRVADIID